jgi:hypothetical protein
MKKINLEKLEVFLDIAKTQRVEQNVKSDLADIMYKTGKGIAYHALALKMYNSSGETEYTDDECELIKEVSQTCAPFFIDAINEILK